MASATVAEADAGPCSKQASSLVRVQGGFALLGCLSPASSLRIELCEGLGGDLVELLAENGCPRQLGGLQIGAQFWPAEQVHD